MVDDHLVDSKGDDLGQGDEYYGDGDICWESPLEKVAGDHDNNNGDDNDGDNHICVRKVEVDDNNDI